MSIGQEATCTQNHGHISFLNDADQYIDPETKQLALMWFYLDDVDHISETDEDDCDELELVEMSQTTPDHGEDYENTLPLVFVQHGL